MSAIVLSSVEEFVDMSPKLQKIGVKNIHFFNSRNNDKLNTPMVALVPFVDAVILGKDARFFSHLSELIDEALQRHIPVVAAEE